MDLYSRLRGMKMLLVEDDALLREALAVFFRSKGCTLRHVPDAEAAVSLLDKERFRIVITDHWLSGMDGLSLLKRVGTEQPEVLRFLITASPTPGMISGEALKDVDGFLLKPFSGTELEAALAETLAKERRADKTPVGFETANR